MTVTADEARTYCRLTADEAGDTVMTELITAAEEYLEGAGVPVPSVPSALYKTAVKALVLEGYDKRGMTSDRPQHELPGLRNTINQLKLAAVAARNVEAEA